MALYLTDLAGEALSNLPHFCLGLVPDRCRAKFVDDAGKERAISHDKWWTLGGRVEWLRASRMQPKPDCLKAARKQLSSWAQSPETYVAGPRRLSYI